MEWILDHLQILIAAAAAVAYWLNQRQQQQTDGEQEPEATFEREDPLQSAEAERARRIREEIRRKIAERAGGSPHPTPVEPPPLFRPPELQPVEVPRSSVNRSPGYYVEADPEVLERQRRLQEQLMTLKRTKAESMRVLEAPVAVSRTSIGEAGLREDLRDRGSLRRAIVLREVLGPPVALR